MKTEDLEFKNLLRLISAGDTEKCFKEITAKTKQAPYHTSYLLAYFYLATNLKKPKLANITLNKLNRMPLNQAESNLLNSFVFNQPKK